MPQYLSAIPVFNCQNSTLIERAFDGFSYYNVDIMLGENY
jgi:hypothetical protein